MVDSWLNIRYPDWYLEYVMTHFRAELYPDAFLGAFSQVVKSENEDIEEVCTFFCLSVSSQ